MKNKNILFWIIFLLIVGVILGFSTWHQWSDNRTTILERMRPVRPIAEFNHGSWIRFIQYYPKNPELIATAGFDNEIKIWNANDQKTPQLTLEPVDVGAGSNSVVGLAFSPIDNWIATKTYWTLEIWDSTSGSKLNTLHIPSGELKISPDGNDIVTASNNIIVWDIRELSNISAKYMLPPKMEWESISLVGLERIISAGISYISHDIPNEYQYATLNQHYKAIDLSHDGKWIAAAAAQIVNKKSKQKIKIWDMQKQRLFRIIERDDPKVHVPKEERKKTLSYTLPPSNVIQSIEFSPNNRFFGLAAGNGYTIWSLPDWKIYHEVLDQRISDIAFSPDGSMYAVADVKGITLWDIETLTPIALLATGGFRGSSIIEFSPDGSTLAGGGYGGVLQIWDMRDYYEE